MIGDLVVEIDLGDIDIAGDVGFDELGGVGADDLAVGGVIGGVATGQEGGITLRFMLVMATWIPLEAASFRFGMEASWLRGAMAMPLTFWAM